MTYLHQQGETEASQHYAEAKEVERRVSLGDQDPKALDDQKLAEAIKQAESNIETSKAEAADKVTALENSFAKFAKPEQTSPQSYNQQEGQTMGKDIQDVALQGGGVLDQMIPIDNTWENSAEDIADYKAQHQENNLNHDLNQEKAAAQEQQAEAQQGAEDGQ